MSDEYTELQAAPPEELLEAAIAAYKQFNPAAERWMRLGFQLAQKDGWEQVAPYWLRMWREKGGDWQSCSCAGCGFEVEPGEGCPLCASYEHGQRIDICPRCGGVGIKDDLGYFCPGCNHEWEVVDRGT